MKGFRSALVTLLCISALAGCSNNAGSSAAPAACQLPAGDTPALVYPANNSTGNTNVNQVIVADQTALGSSWDVAITSQSGGAAYGGPFVIAPSPLPSPNSPPPFSNPVYESSSLGGTLAPGLVWQVYVNYTGNNCTPTGPIGHFST